MSRGTTFFVPNPMYRDVQATQFAATNVNVGNISITTKNTQSVRATAFQPALATQNYWQPSHYGPMYPQAFASGATTHHPGPMHVAGGQPTYYNPPPGAKEYQQPPHFNSGGAAALRPGHGPTREHGQPANIPPQSVKSSATYQRGTGISSDGTAVLRPPPVTSEQSPHVHSPPQSMTSTPYPQSIRMNSGGTPTLNSPPDTTEQLAHSPPPTMKDSPYPQSMNLDSTATRQTFPGPGPMTPVPAAHVHVSPPSVKDNRYAQGSNIHGATIHATGGQLCEAPPKSPIEEKHPMHLSMQKSSDGFFSRLFKRSRRSSHKVEHPNQEQQEEADDHDIALTMFEYPSQIEKEQLIEQEPERDEPVGSDDAKGLPLNSLPEEEENEVTFIDCVDTTTTESFSEAGGQPSDSPLPDQQQPFKDALYPMRAKKTDDSGKKSNRQLKVQPPNSLVEVLVKPDHVNELDSVLTELEHSSQVEEEQSKQKDDILDPMLADMFSDDQQSAALLEDPLHPMRELNTKKTDDFVKISNRALKVQTSNSSVEVSVKADDVNEPDSVLTEIEHASQVEEEQCKKEDEKPIALDILHPMRADMLSDDSINQSHGTDKTHIAKSPGMQVEDYVMPQEAESATEMTDTVETLPNVGNPLPATYSLVHVAIQTQSPNKQCVSESVTNNSEQVEDTDSPQKSSAESTAAPVDIQVYKEPLQQEEVNVNQRTFINGVEDPPTMEEKIEKIMPKEDREMYKAVIDCIVTSEDNKKCCSCKDCFSSCCFSVSCAIASPTSICKQGGTKTENITTETLQKGAQSGWNIFQKLAFPLMRPLFRDLIAISELVISIIGLILSLISFSLGNNAGYNIFHIVLAFIATILGGFDTFASLSSCEGITKPCKNCKKKCADSKEMSTCIQKLKIRLKKGWDIGRLIIVELIFYPLLISDLIEFIVDKGYRFEAENATDVMGFFLVVHSFASQMFYVYILRLVVLIAMIIHIHKKRTLPQDKKELAAALEKETDGDHKNKSDGDEENDKLNRDIAADGIKFQSYFAFHVAGQMAAQILMIVAISITIDKENADKTLDDPIHISNELWFMMVAGYVIPLVGILTFFIPTFYWTYEHPNGICLNLLSILETPGIGHVVMFGENTKDIRSKVIEITKHLNKDQLKKDFLNLRDQAFSNKLFYPFKSPVLVVVCLAYSFCQFAFVLIAILSIQNGDPGTVFFYFLSVVVGIVANVYVLAVAAFWTTIIVGILLLIAIVIALFVLACILLSCGSSKSSRETRVY